MFNKKFIIPILAIVIVVLIGFIQINIINTKALSPIGNSEDNYKLVSTEFGEDFTEFIKDNAEVKIYTEEEEEGASVKVAGKEIRLKKENPFIKVFVVAGSKVKDGFVSVKDKVDNKIKDINKNNAEKENKNSKLDSTVDDFIEGRGENKNSIEEPKSEETNWEDNFRDGNDE